MTKSFEHIWEETKTILDIRELSVKYGKAEALKNINFSVPASGITTLIGANGAGKTSLLRAISGLIKLNNGEILFKNKRIDQLRPSEIVTLGIAHVPEGRRLFPEMTVLENLELGAYTQKNAESIKTNLEKVLSYFPDLKMKLNQEARMLSGGQQQMVAIGRALMADPQLLLLDEPSIGLAPIIVEEIGEIIKDINKEGVSILLIEQDAHLALNLAQYGYVIETGNIQISGDSKFLLENEEVKVAYLGL